VSAARRAVGDGAATAVAVAEMDSAAADCCCCCCCRIRCASFSLSSLSLLLCSSFRCSSVRDAIVDVKAAKRRCKASSDSSSHSLLLLAPYG